MPQRLRSNQETRQNLADNDFRHTIVAIHLAYDTMYQSIKRIHLNALVAGQNCTTARGLNAGIAIHVDT